MERSSSRCEPVRTSVRVVGFKIADNVPSPTSVVGEIAGGNSNESPRSKLAEALKREGFRPLPRLRIRSTPRKNVPSFRRSLSHADLNQKEQTHVSSDRSEPATPGSRASTASTPMKIPSSITKVHTCPIELTEFQSETPYLVFSGRHTRRHSDCGGCDVSLSLAAPDNDILDEDIFVDEDDSIVRDLFQAGPAPAVPPHQPATDHLASPNRVDTSGHLVGRIVQGLDDLSIDKLVANMHVDDDRTRKTDYNYSERGSMKAPLEEVTPEAHPKSNPTTFGNNAALRLPAAAVAHRRGRSIGGQ